MAVTICDNNDYMVEPVSIQACLIEAIINLLLNCLEQLAEVAGTCQGRPNDALLISIQDLHRTKATWIFTTIEVPESTDLVPVAHVVWNTAETVHIETAIFAVFAHDVTDLEDGLLVLVHSTMLHLSM